MSDQVKNFETARTRHFRTTQLNENDQNVISKIEEYGCFVISVSSNCKDELGWSYTIGVFDTAGKPDLITVGLPPKVAHSCLNEAARRLRAGIDLTQGRHADLIGNVDCEFRPVDPRWVKHLMNWANWYYGRADYPVLQAIYPDLENRLPEDKGFNRKFAQPMMQPSVPFTEVEQDFWDSFDAATKFPDWKFPDRPHTAAILSKAVHSGTEPINFVSRDADDGGWQFLGDTMTDSGGVVVCLHHPIDEDPSLVELADLPIGWYAGRDAPGQPWHRKELPPHEENAEATDSEE